MQASAPFASNTSNPGTFSNVTNLANMCGDAKRILGDHFAAGQVEGVYVNHPEPPQQVGFNYILHSTSLFIITGRLGTSLRAKGLIC